MPLYTIEMTDYAECDLADLGVRRTNFDNYDIFYFIDESILTVYIIRILHSLTDYRSHLYQIINI